MAHAHPIGRPGHDPFVDCFVPLYLLCASIVEGSQSPHIRLSEERHRLHNQAPGLEDVPGAWRASSRRVFLLAQGAWKAYKRPSISSSEFPSRICNYPSIPAHQYIKQMDSFTTVSVPTSEVPTSQETGGSGGNAYCVVSRTDSIPTNEETGGSGGNAYCVVA
ncbi:hypothetical protein CVT26_010663 [Gymnopilus dilepis]|uniref:Uncharacterized protein n=1 Tax=Gymnopilus dilepis TaxID=231916 RepID=A0A409VIC6_9AGAR|nr:hypothetical protein CVT26_010663 [Gymnopilus dilepis]